MNEPSTVSNRHMPAVNRIGRQSTAYQGRASAALVLANTSSETSDAVSKPNPNRTPTGYMCHALVTALVAPPSSRFMKPPHSQKHGWLYNLTERGFAGWLRFYRRSMWLTDLRCSNL